MDEQGPVTVDGERPGKRQKERPRTRPVRVLKVTGGAALVEYAEDEAAIRMTVPAEAVSDEGLVGLDVLVQGVPYGLPWEKAPTGRVTAAMVAAALHNAGIWTADDLRDQPRAALGALQAAYGLDLAALNAFARNFGKEPNDG